MDRTRKYTLKKLTPLRAVRLHCLSCTNGDVTYVRKCSSSSCDVHPIRFGRNDGKIRSVLRAIRRRCLDCCGDERKRVAECELKDCSLYPFRMGTNPNRKGATIPKAERSQDQ